MSVLEQIPKSASATPEKYKYSTLLRSVSAKQDALTSRLWESRGADLGRDELVFEHLAAIQRETTRVEAAPVSDVERRLMSQILDTEILRINLARTPGNQLRKLNNIRQAAQWQREQAAAIAEILERVDQSAGKEIIHVFWADQARIFSHPFDQSESEQSLEDFERYKTGVLAAVSVEHVVRKMPGWHKKKTRLDDDTHRGIDLMAGSPEGNLFFLQIKGKSAPDSPEIIHQILRPGKTVGEDQRRFVDGVSRYVKSKKVDLSQVRSMWLEIGTRFVDEDTGIPSPDLDETLTQALEEADDLPRGWN